MAKTTGYRLRHEHIGKTAVCTECANAVSLNNRGSMEELDTRQIASEFCVICEEDITDGNGGEIDYPPEITILLRKHFEKKGSRFGGVNPRIDNASKETNVSEAATVSKPQPTPYDPVVGRLSADEGTLAQELDAFFDKLSARGAIRGSVEEQENEDDETVGYLFTSFARQ